MFPRRVFGCGFLEAKWESGRRKITATTGSNPEQPLIRFLTAIFKTILPI